MKYIPCNATKQILSLPLWASGTKYKFIDIAQEDSDTNNQLLWRSWQQMSRIYEDFPAFGGIC